MERIQKILAQHGFGSRRRIEDLLREEKIRVNGHIAKLGDKIDGNEKVSINGKPIKLSKISRKDFKLPRIILLNKPDGVMCTRDDPEGRRTVFSLLPKIKSGRWISIGRLDLNTGGLLLFTNDGEVAHRAMHPSFEVEREYAVRILGQVSPVQIQSLKTGVILDDGSTGKFTTVVDKGGEGANHWYHVSLSRGRNREVRKLWESLGVKVSRLIRIRYGAITLPRNLRRGKVIPLDDQQVKAFCEALKLEL